MPTVIRFDNSPLGKSERTPQGGLRVPATLTRTGIFEYLNPDGTIRREYRPADEVFKASSLDTIKGAPVTNQHPGKPVTTENFRELVVGHVGDDVRQEGDHVAATVYVQDASVIELIENGDRREVSLGYSVDFDPTPGSTADGARYDGVQRNPRINHLALVPRGRAGSAMLRLDAADNAIPFGATQVKILFGGKEYEAGSPELAKAIEDQTARLDALEKANKELVAKEAKATRDRYADLARARKVEFRADADATEIMTATIQKLLPGFTVDGQSPEFILGAFSAAIHGVLPNSEDPPPDEEPAPAATPDPRADVLEGRRPRVDRSDEEEETGPARSAREKMIARLRRGEG